MTTTDQLARFCVGSAAALPERVRARTARVVVDTMAVTIAGCVEPPLRALEAALYASNDAVAVRIPWRDARYRPEDACLLVGTASHVLDYDDVSMVAVCHPTAPVLTALYVLAQQVAVSGAAFLDALAIGTEVTIRSGAAMGFRHYALGFHATATLGTLGTAAACARVLQLSPARTAHALAIAASMSAGLRKNFGTTVKPLHVGLAAANGLRAARLAQSGLEGAGEVLDGGGWLHAFSGGETDAWGAAVDLGNPFAIDEPGFEQKRYPCCYMMHKIIEATLALRREHRLSLEGFERAEVLMPRGGSAPLIHPLPANGLAAKFSGTYAVVAALADGRVDLASFEDEAVRRRAIQQACPAVTLIEADTATRHGSDVGSAPVTVTLVYSGGRRFSRTVTVSPGSSDDPLTDEDLRRKWGDCMRRGLPRLAPDDVNRLYHTGLELQRQPSAGRWLLRVAQPG